MERPTKLYERVFITGFISNTKEDGEILTLLGMDGLSFKLHDPVFVKKFQAIEDIADMMVQMFNAINKDYKRNIHAQSTEYITDLSKDFHPFMKAMMMKEDTLVYDPIATQKAFKDVFELMGIK